MTDQTQTVGTSIRIFLVDGDPDGFRIVEKSNWSGQAVVVSRSQYPEVRARREFDAPGVYVLLAPAGEDDANLESMSAKRTPFALALTST